MVRNAAIAAGNSGSPKFRPLLEKLVGDLSPVVAEAAEWALERLTRAPSRHAGLDPASTLPRTARIEEKVDPGSSPG
jgi:hypothetical protein